MTARHIAQNMLFRAILVITLAILPLAKTDTPSFANSTTVLSASSFENLPPVETARLFPRGGFRANQQIAHLFKVVHWPAANWGACVDYYYEGEYWEKCYGTSEWRNNQWVCYEKNHNRDDGVAIGWAGGSPFIPNNFPSHYFHERVPYGAGGRADEHNFWITHRLYAPMWYGGFYYDGHNNRIEVCAIVSSVANQELQCVSFNNWGSYGHWMSGFPLGNSYRFSANPVSTDAFRIFGKNGVSTIIVSPHQRLDSSLDMCPGVNTPKVLVLKNGAVPAFTINGFDLRGNPSAHMFLESEVTDAINRHPFSCAGPVFQNNNRMIMPPGCGIRDGNGANLYFGSFTQSGSLRQFGSTSDLRKLSNYKQNNRAMIFQYGGRSVARSSAILLVADNADSEKLPLTIIVPPLTIDVGRGTFREHASKIFVARTDTGQVAKVEVNPSGPTTIVVAPEVVSEVARSGGEIVVRAVAIGDRQSTCGGRAGRVITSTHMNYDFWVDACFDHSASNLVQEVSRGNMFWFTPVAAVTSYAYHWRYKNFPPAPSGEGTINMVLGQAFYYRFVGDVAQASIRLIPVQSRVNMIGEEDIRIALQPNLPQVSRNYVQAGGDIWVGTDVRISPWIYARGDAIRVSYVVTHTDPVSGTMVYSGVMKPDAIEIVGTISQRDGIYQRWSGSEKIILNQANNYSYESSLGWVASELLPCYRYDQRKCRPRADRIDGELRITATAVITISSSEVPEGIPVRLLSTKTIRPYWNVLYFEETR